MGSSGFNEMRLDPMIRNPWKLKAFNVKQIKCKPKYTKALEQVKIPTLFLKCCNGK
jgi:hypothetical protein